MPEIDPEYHDERNSLLCWYGQVKDIDIVNTPKTKVFRGDFSAPLERMNSESELTEEEVKIVDFLTERAGASRERAVSVVDAIDEIPVNEVVEFQKSLGKKCDLRGLYKSSSFNERGNVISEPTPTEVTIQIAELLNSLYMQSFETTGFAVREFLDIEGFKDEAARRSCPYQVRFIIDEGEVAGWFPYPDEEILYTEPALPGIDEAKKVIREKVEQDEKTLNKMTKAVADEVGGNWSVDYLRTTNGTWCLTDMALYAIYWNEEKDRWQNMSYVPEGHPCNLEENPPQEVQNDERWGLSSGQNQNSDTVTLEKLDDI